MTLVKLRALSVTLVKLRTLSVTLVNLRALSVALVNLRALSVTLVITVALVNLRALSVALVNLHALSVTQVHSRAFLYIEFELAQIFLVGHEEFSPVLAHTRQELKKNPSCNSRVRKATVVSVVVVWPGLKERFH